MASGYVLNFSNRTFEEFVLDSTGRNIFDSRYDHGSGSKANRLRAFWQKEDNRVVGKLLKDLLDCLGETSPTVEMCRLIVSRLLNGSPAPAPEIAVSPQQSQALSQLKDDTEGPRSEKDDNGTMTKPLFGLTSPPYGNQRHFESPRPGKLEARRTPQLHCCVEK